MGCGSSQVAAEPSDVVTAAHVTGGGVGGAGGSKRGGSVRGGSVRGGGLKVNVPTDSPYQLESPYRLPYGTPGSPAPAGGAVGKSPKSASSPFAISAMDGIARVASLRLHDDDPLSPLHGEEDGGPLEGDERGTSSSGGGLSSRGAAGGGEEEAEDEVEEGAELPGRTMSAAAGMGSRGATRQVLGTWLFMGPGHGVLGSTAGDLGLCFASVLATAFVSTPCMSDAPRHMTLTSATPLHCSG